MADVPKETIIEICRAKIQERAKHKSCSCCPDGQRDYLEGQKALAEEVLELMGVPLIPDV